MPDPDNQGKPILKSLTLDEIENLAYTNKLNELPESYATDTTNLQEAERLFKIRVKSSKPVEQYGSYFKNDISRWDKGIPKNILFDPDLRREYRADAQPTGNKIGNLWARGIAKAGISIVEPFGHLLDIEEQISAINGTERNFGNWFNDMLKGWEQSLDESMPIHTKKEEPALFSADWWLKNGDQMIKSVGYVVPGGALFKGSSWLLKASRITKLLKLSAPAANTFNRVGSAVLSATALNYSEHMLSATQAFNDNKKAYIEMPLYSSDMIDSKVNAMYGSTIKLLDYNIINTKDSSKKQEYINEKSKVERLANEYRKNLSGQKKYSSEEAYKLAAQDAEEIIWGGKINLLWEIPEQLALFRGIKQTRTWGNQIEKGKRWVSNAKKYGAVSGQEYMEEVTTGYYENEAERNMKLRTGQLVDDGSNEIGRFFNHLASYEGLTEGWSGAFGGGGMAAISTISEKKEANIARQRMIENAALINDKESFEKLQREQLYFVVLDNARKGTVENWIEKLKVYKDMSEDEARKLDLIDNEHTYTQFQQKIDRYIKESEEIEKIYNDVSSKHITRQNVANKLIVLNTSKYAAENNISDINNNISELESKIRTHSVSEKYKGYTDLFNRRIELDKLKENIANKEKYFKTLIAEDDSKTVKKDKTESVKRIKKGSEHKYINKKIDEYNTDILQLQMILDDLHDEYTELENKIKKDINIAITEEFTVDKLKSLYENYSKEISKDSDELMSLEINKRILESGIRAIGNEIKEVESNPQLVEDAIIEEAKEINEKARQDAREAKKNQKEAKQNASPVNTDNATEELVASIENRYRNINKEDGTNDMFTNERDELIAFLNKRGYIATSSLKTNDPKLFLNAVKAKSRDNQQFLELLREYYSDINKQQDQVIKNEIDSNSEVTPETNLGLEVIVEQADGISISDTEAKEKTGFVGINFDREITGGEKGKEHGLRNEFGIEHDKINDSQFIPVGEQAYIEIDLDNKYNKELDDKDFAHKAAMVYVIYRNGERIVLGAVRSYDANNKFSGNRNLKYMRDDAVEEMRNKGVRSGTFKFSKTVKVKAKYTGRIFHIKKDDGTPLEQNPVKILRKGEPLVFAIAIRNDKGKTIIEVPNAGSYGTKYAEFVGKGKELPVGMNGRTFMMVEASNGKIIPVLVRVKKVGEVKDVHDKIMAELKDISNDNWKEKRDNINQFAKVNFLYNNGKFTHIKVIDGKEEKINIKNVEEWIDGLVLYVDKKTINGQVLNEKNYNENISNQGWVVTDLNPVIHTHSTTFEFTQYDPKGNIDYSQPARKSPAKPTGVIPTSGDELFDEKTSEVVPNEKVSSKPIDGIPTVNFGIGKPKMKPAENGEYIEWNEQEELEWLKKNLPKIPVTVDNVQAIRRISGIKAFDGWGAFFRAAIYIHQKAGKGTGYHEAFHAVFSMYLTLKQQQQLEKEAKLAQQKETDPKLKSKYYEEYLADKFMEYVIDQKENMTLGKKINNFFKNLWYFIKGMITSSVTSDQVFHNINRGKYKNSVDISPKFAWNRVKYRIPGWTPYEEYRRTQTTTVFFFSVLEYLRTNDPELSSLDDIQILQNIQNRDYMGFKAGESALKKIFLIIRESAKQEFTENGTIDDPKVQKYLYEIMNDDGEAGGLYDNVRVYLRNFGINISKKTLDINKVYETSEENPEEGIVLDDNTQFGGWETDHITKNNKEQLSYNVKKMMMTLYLTDKDGNIVLDELGIPRLVEFNNLYNVLENNLSDIYDSKEMMDKLSSMTRVYPEINALIEKLNEDDGLRSAFIVNFTKTHANYLMVEEKKKGDNKKVNVYSANRVSITQEIISGWKSNIDAAGSNVVVNSEGKVDEKQASKLKERFDKFSERVRIEDYEFTEDDFNELEDIMSKFGIDITAGQYEDIVKLDSKNLKTLIIGSKGFSNIINTFAKGNNVFDDDIESSEVSSLREIATELGKVLHDLFQQSHRNTENKTVFGIINPNYLSKKTKRLKNKDYRNDLKRSDFSGSIVWLDELDNEENMKNFEYALLDGYKPANRSKGSKYTKLTDAEFDAVNFNAWYNGGKKFGWYMMPIFSDSPTSAFIKFKKYDTAQNKRTGTNEMLEMFYLVALQEARRIKKVKNRKKQEDVNRYKSYDGTRGENFLFLPMLNDATFDILDPSNKQATLDMIEGFLDKETVNEKKRLRKLGVIDNKEKSKDLVGVNMNDNILKAYVWNKIFANIQMIQLYSNDLAFYSNTENFFKRNKQVWSPGLILDSTASWTDKNGNTTTVNKSWNTIVAEESIVGSEHVETIRKILENSGMSKKDVDVVMVEYTLTDKDGIKETDGQSYITIDRYREIQIGFGRWNDVYEDMYRKVKDGGYLSVDELSLIMQPNKPFVYTEIYDEELNEYVPLEFKCSEFLLLPQFVEKVADKKLRNILEYMQLVEQRTGKTTSVVFPEVVKVGISSIATMQDVENNIEREKNPEAVTGIKDIKFIEVNNEDYKLQQEVPEHHEDTEIPFGVQVLRLAISDLSKEVDYLIGKGQKKKADDLVKLYNELITANIIEEYERLIGKFESPAKLRELLLEEVERMQLGEEFIDALEMIDDNFVLPLYFPTHARRIESLINSLFSNRILKQKINGGTYVNVSSFGYSDQLEVKINETTGAIEYIECYLPIWAKDSLYASIDENGMIRPEDVPEELKYLIAYRIPTEDKYSMLPLKVKGFIPRQNGGGIILPKEILSISGLDFDIDKMFIMIPNHGVQKYDKNRAKKDYLRAASGTKELIDKLFDTDSEVSDDALFEEWWKDNKESYKLDKPKVYKIKYNYNKPPEQQSKAARDNAIMDIIRGVLTNPATAPSILSTGKPIKIKSVVRDIRKIRNIKFDLNPALPSTMAEVFRRNMTGKDLIGIFAVHNAAHAVLQHTNVEFSEDIRFDGMASSSLHEILDTDGRPISKNIAEFLFISVDNAKDPLANDINVNEFTADVLVSILSTGYTIPTAVYFIAQPSLVELSSEYAKQGGGLMAERKSISDLIRKIGSRISDFTSLDMEGRIEGISNFNTKDLRENIIMGEKAHQEWDEIQDKYHGLTDEKSLNDKAVDEKEHKNKYRDYYIKQYDILVTFRKYKELANSLSKGVRALRADSIGAGPILANNEFFERSVQTALEDDNIKNLEELFDTTTHYTIVKTLADKGIFSATDFLKKYFPWSNNLMLAEKSKIANYKIMPLSAEEINYLNYSIMSYVTSGFGAFSHENFDSIVNDFPREFKKIKDTDPEFASNGIVRKMFFRAANKKVSIDRISFKNNGSITTHERTMIAREWGRLFATHPEAAKKLMQYAFFSNGFMYGPNTFINLVPVETWKLLSDDNGLLFIDYLKNFNEETKEVSDIYWSFFDQFHRNNYRRSNWTPKVLEDHSNVSDIIKDKDGNISVITIDSENVKDKGFIINKDKRTGNITTPIYIAIAEDNNVVLLQRESQKGNVVVFRTVEHLGVHNYALEYDIYDPALKTSVKKKKAVSMFGGKEILSNFEYAMPETSVDGVDKLDDIAIVKDQRERMKYMSEKFQSTPMLPTNTALFDDNGNIEWEEFGGEEDVAESATNIIFEEDPSLETLHDKTIESTKEERKDSEIKNKCKGKGKGNIEWEEF